jgi:biopolymer transport protein ExbD
MAKKLDVQEEITPNLIPMIDIMFLLLLFFMLGADMGHRELEEVILPKALAVKEEKGQRGVMDDKLVVNIFHVYDVPCEAYANEQTCRERKHWRIGISGRDFTDLKKLEMELKKQGARSRAAPMPGLSSGQQVPFSERVVMVRADASAPYGHVQEVVNSCAKVGIYKIECGASRPPDAEFADTKQKG